LAGIFSCQIATRLLDAGEAKSCSQISNLSRDPTAGRWPIQRDVGRGPAAERWL